MRLAIALAALIAIGLAPPVVRAAAPPTRLSEADQEFLDKAVQNGLAEIAFGQLAEKNAAAPAVKDFARRMIDAHRQLNGRLGALARAKDFAPPQELEKDVRDLHDNVAPIKGADFDRFYMSQEIGFHRSAIALYITEAEQGKDPDIKGLVAETLPQIQQRYAEARAIDATLPMTAPLMSSSGTVEDRQPYPDPFPGK